MTIGLSIVVAATALCMCGLSSTNAFLSSGIHPGMTKTRASTSCLQTRGATTSTVDMNPYHYSKVKDEEYDAIVVGSGIGGLSAASMLAQNDKKVLVLEQHYVAGGACHTFTRKGYTFGTGIHYVGDAGELLPGQSFNLRTILNTLTGKDDQVEWDQMNGTWRWMRFCWHSHTRNIN